MSVLYGVVTASLGYLSTAGSQVIDKALLEKTFRHPVSLAFWSAVFSLGIFIFLLVDSTLPKLHQWPLVILTGFLFQAGLLAYYNVAAQEEISKASTVIGAVTPIATLLLARFLLAERLLANQSVGFILALIGTLSITYTAVPTKKTLRLFLLSLLSGLLFAISAVTTKEVFKILPFIPGLIWSRVGGLLFAGLLLAPTQYRRFIFSKKEQPQGRKAILFLFGQGLGALGFFLINLAIFFSSPTIVNALQGFRYGALFLLALLFSHWWPNVYGESFSKAIIAKKVLGLIFIAIGMVIMTI